MRTENEMMSLILDFARQRDDVRAVVMTGSRANPAAPRDRFQDYDITYLVRDVSPYRRNPGVPSHFGEMMILQTPDDGSDAPSSDTSYAYLMQFADGNRIDLTFRSLDDVGSILEDSLSVAVFDKDRRFALPPPTLRSYLPLRPTSREFADCCNEFWWLNPYVAKGLYRDQIAYAKAIFDGPMRRQLMIMLTWYVGLATNFQESVGYLGRNLKVLLPGEVWDSVERTYSDAHPDRIWESLFATAGLFRRLAREIAAQFAFSYPEREDTAVSDFVRRIRDSMVP